MGVDRFVASAQLTTIKEWKLNVLDLCALLTVRCCSLPIQTTHSLAYGLRFGYAHGALMMLVRCVSL